MLQDRALAVTYMTDADLLEEAGREAAQRAHRVATDKADKGGFR
jgi:hypothetical protein